MCSILCSCADEICSHCAIITFPSVVPSEFTQYHSWKQLVSKASQVGNNLLVKHLKKNVRPTLNLIKTDQISGRSWIAVRLTTSTITHSSWCQAQSMASFPVPPNPHFIPWCTEAFILWIYQVDGSWCRWCPMANRAQLTGSKQWCDYLNTQAVI